MMLGCLHILPATAMIFTAQVASAQHLGQGQEDPVSLGRILLVLLLCILLAVGGAFAMKAGLPRLPIAKLVRKDRRMQLVETLRLTNHVDLCLVTFDEKPMLLATSAKGVQILPYPPAAQDGQIPPLETAV